MRVRLDMTGALLECRVPSTAAEVLDFRVRIRCITDDEARLMAARQWFVDHVIEIREPPADWTPDDGEPPYRVVTDVTSFCWDWPTAEGEPSSGSTWLFAACDTLIRHASLPEQVIEDVVRLEDRKNGIPEPWKPTPKCDCLQCQWDPDDGPVPELPPEHTCLFDGLDPRAALVVSEIAGVEDLSQPWWAVQAQRALQVAQWRRFRHDKEERELQEKERFEYMQRAAELGDLLKGGRR